MSYGKNQRLMSNAFVSVLRALLTAVLVLTVAGVVPTAAYAVTAPTVTVTRAATGKVSLKVKSSYSLGVKASSGKLTYKSSKPAVVTVSKAGKLAAKKTGKATITITAKNGSKKAVKKIRVSVLAASKYKAVKKITAKASASTLVVGQTAKISAAFNPSNASNKNVTYKSSDPSVASVSVTGVITAKKAGTTKITVASCANGKAKANVTITVKTPPPVNVAVDSVELSQQSIDIEVGEYATISAYASPKNATDKGIVWSTSDENIAEVDNGVITGIDSGLAIITATAPSGASADCEVYVSALGTESYEQFIQAYTEMVHSYDSGFDGDNPPDDPYDNGRLIVKDSGSNVDYYAFSEQPVDVLDDGEGIFIVQYANSADARQAAAEIAEVEGVEWVEPDAYLDIDADGEGEEDDLSAQSFSSCLSWGIPVMGLDDMAESLSYVKGGVIVAVLDSGLTPAHKLFKGKVMNGYSVFPDKDDTADAQANGHGTHVAGIIAESTQNLMGVKILPVRVLPNSLPNMIASGVKYAVLHGAKVINMSLSSGAYWVDSLGITIPIKCINEAIESAVEHGVTVVVAAGNNNKDTSGYTPANCNRAIVVGAIDSSLSLRASSNTGETLDFVAPGENILSCAIDGGTKKMNGTSQASPHIAAAVAMIKLKHPEYSPYDIEQVLRQCSTDLGVPGRDDQYGYGLPGLSRIIEVEYDTDEDNDFWHDYCGTCWCRIDSNGYLIVNNGELPSNDSNEASIHNYIVSDYFWPWNKICSDCAFELRGVYFGSGVKLSGSLAGMFSSYGFRYMTDFSFLSDLDLSEVTSLAGMFAHCQSLSDVSYISKWNVSNVEDMSGMFAGCQSLSNVSPLSRWNVSNVEDMSYMFRDCQSLSDASPLSRWEPSDSLSTSHMFDDCAEPITLPTWYEE